MAAVAQELILSLGSAGRALFSMINEFHLVASKSVLCLAVIYLCFLLKNSCKKTSFKVSAQYYATD